MSLFMGDVQYSLTRPSTWEMCNIPSRGLAPAYADSTFKTKFAEINIPERPEKLVQEKGMNLV
jgi:hypothetical protein